MIDFDNNDIGGGVWEEDVHKERQFLYISELLIRMCVSFYMNDKEANGIYGAERLSNYT